jgi:aminopeptidase YwaD
MNAPDPVSLRERLQTNVLACAHPRDPQFSPLGHQAIQVLIQEKLGQWGKVWCHKFQHQGRWHCNWGLDLPGQKLPGQALLGQSKRSPPILIAAHYDSIFQGPGADDNASGLAVLLEMAQAFAQEPARSPLRLVAFDLEEPGLLGSRAYAQHLAQSRQPLRLMLSLEMLGLDRLYPHTADFIALIGPWQSLPDLWQLRRAIRQPHTSQPHTSQQPTSQPHTSQQPTSQKRTGCEILPIWNRGLPLPITRRSDHAPFWDQGYPAILVTDTAELRNPHYHQTSDTPDTLDYDFLAGVCAGLIRGIRQF